MDYSALLRRAARIVPVVSVLLFALLPAYGQGGGGGRGAQSLQSARAAAPIDLTGYWVSIVSEDWSYRMVTPPKGDYRHIYMLNAEGRRVAKTWDPARQIANGEQCKAYGAVGVTRQPGRWNISWQDDNTLKIDFDNGTQTRLLRFGNPPPPAGRSLQGHSVAEWEFIGTRPTGGGAAPGRPPATGQVPGGALKVVTTKMLPGYVRTNGVPYSEDAILTEYFDRHSELGQEWITHTRILEDPKYLTEPHIVTSNFKKEPDGSKWHPTSCEVIPPESILSPEYDFDAEPGNGDER
jgi:hypothetical protein